jgi:hypothetical protein
MAILNTLKTLVSLLYVFYIVFSIFQYRDRRGHEPTTINHHDFSEVRVAHLFRFCVVLLVGFTSTCAIGAYRQ